MLGDCVTRIPILGNQWFDAGYLGLPMNLERSGLTGSRRASCRTWLRVDIPWQPSSCKDHSYVHAIPSRREIVWRHPRSDNFETSRSLRGVPLGLLASQARLPSNPTTSQINSANSRMDTFSPQPTLIFRGSHISPTGKRGLPPRHRHGGIPVAACLSPRQQSRALASFLLRAFCAKALARHAKKASRSCR